MSNVPTLHTERLLLRELVMADEPAYTRYFVNYEVIRNLAAGVPWPYPEGGVRDFLENHLLPSQGSDRWAWALTLPERPEELIGALDLCREAAPSNRGFWLGQPFWGRGYMTEAARAVNDYAFEHLGFEKLTFRNAVGNRRSGRIKEKTGARLIGTEPAQYVDPLLTESEVYELTREDWRAARLNVRPPHAS